jgi:TonB family protein
MIAVVLACAAAFASQVERDLKSGKKQLHLTVLAPIRIELTSVSMKGGEPMIEVAREMELPLTLEIEAALRDLGYPLDVESWSKEALAKDADGRYAVDDLQKKFDAVFELMHRKSKGVRNGRFSLGDEVAKLPLSENVDGLLFVRVRGQVLTESRKTFGTFIAGPRSDFVVMDFGLVDARTGDVLYFAKSTVTGSLVTDSDEVAGGIAKAFANLPKASRSELGGSLHSLPQDATVSTAGARTITSTESGKAIEPATAVLLPADVRDSSLPARPLRLSRVVMKGTLIKQVAPEYPQTAKENLVHGDVVMRVVIDRTGQVTNVAVVSGPIELISAATSAIKQWRYRPFTVRGQVFEVETKIVATFKIGG